MKGFRFHLERVLEWRRTELELEQRKFEQQTKELLQLDSERANIEAAAIRSEIEVRAWYPLEGRDLAALAAFRRHVAAQEKEIDTRRGEARRETGKPQGGHVRGAAPLQTVGAPEAASPATMAGAADRELEELAAESYIARFARESFEAG